MQTIDAHTHFWDTDKLDYPWLKAHPLIDKTLLPEDFKNEAKEEINGYLFIQGSCAPEQALKEVEWAVGLAEKGFPIVGIVAYYPAENGSRARNHLVELSHYPLVKGVRRNYSSDRNMATTDAFVEAVQALQDFELTFDLNFDFHQFPETLELVRQCPDVTFIIDHLAKPGIQYELLDDWKRQLSLLSKHTNVYAKVSGLFNEALPNQRNINSLEPYLDFAMDIFGPLRLMYGGDWPVIKLAGSYIEWLNLVKSWVGSRPESDQKAFFVDNAVKVYNLTNQ